MKPVICEKRKGAQRSTLGVVDHGEPWLKLEEALDEVWRQKGARIAREIVKNVLSVNRKARGSRVRS